jgi:3-oxoacyl-[acyl-carrier protein] reductase
MEPVSLKGKVAVVSGASRGMGREMALAFANAGAKGVIVTAAPASDENQAEIQAELDGVVAEIVRAGSRGIGIQADITNVTDAGKVMSQTIETFGALHILVNNAGKSQRYHGARGANFWETEPDGWRLVIDTNVVGSYIMSRAAIPDMLKAGWGRIIITSKNSDSMHEPHAGAYGPSKAALDAEMLSWAEEVAGSGVTINSIVPGGAVATKFGRGIVNNTGLDPAVVVPVALWLASDQSSDFNGCRFNAKYWDQALPNVEAAMKCREQALFREPTRHSKLKYAWLPSDVR